MDAQFVSLESIIDRDFEKLDQEFYDYLSKKMAQAVEQCGNKVPVVTGNWIQCTVNCRKTFFLTYVRGVLTRFLWHCPW